MKPPKRKPNSRIVQKKALKKSVASASRLNGGSRDQLRSGNCVVAGVDIGGTNLRVALADTNGNLLGTWRTSTETSSSPEMVVASIRQGVEHLLTQVRVPQRSLRSIAAGVPGVTDAKSGVVVATSYLRGWRNVPFQHLLASALGVPATIENDVRLAAIGERWKGAAQGIDDFIFLALGTGIAAGIFANGQLLRGTNFTAGEVGYMYVPGCSGDPVDACSPGSLESSIGGEGVRQRWRQLAGPELHHLTATEIYSRANAEDSLAKTVLEESARLLAYAIYNISLVLNTSLFVLGGGVGTSADLRNSAERILLRYKEPVHPRITVSTLGTEAQLTGAIRLALTSSNLAAN